MMDPRSVQCRRLSVITSSEAHIYILVQGYKSGQNIKYKNRLVHLTSDNIFNIGSTVISRTVFGVLVGNGNELCYAKTSSSFRPQQYREWDESSMTNAMHATSYTIFLV